MKAIRITLEVLSVAILTLCAVTLLVFSLPATGLKALNVATGSMRPAIVPGSLVIIHRVPYGSLKVGDVITYKDPRKLNETITHRIVKVTTIGNSIPAFITKGDANKVPDPIIAGGSVVGKVVWHVPVVGGLANSIKKPVYLLLLVAIPGLLVIIFELVRLVRVLSRRETREDTLRSPPKASSSQKKEVLPVAPMSKRRGIDGLMKIALLSIVTLFAVGNTHALLKSSASLTDNVVGSAPIANHLLINEIVLGTEAGTGCPSSLTSITINTTGNNSTNTVDVNSTCTITNINSSNVNISNNNNQSASSGNVGSSNSSSSGSETSGNVSENSNTSTTITINNGSGSTSGSPAAIVQLYNPTAVAVSLSGWKLESAGASQAFGSTLSVPAHGSLAVAYSAEALQRSGGRLLLIAPDGTTIDAVSWGSDTSQLNPSAPAIGADGILERVTLGFDTNTAADWKTQ